MGADLYIESLFNPNMEQYRPEFDRWVQRRDELKAARKVEEAKAAQQKVMVYFDRMYEKGYFRDSANDSNLLVKFGMNWWAEINVELIDAEGKMSPANAQQLLEWLSERESVFETSLQNLTAWEGWTQAQTQDYFRDKYGRLKEFLQAAVDSNSPILCSL